MLGWANDRLDRKQLEQSLGRARRPLKITDHLAYRARGAGHDHCIEDERRKLAGGDATGNDIVTADPKDHPDGAEYQHDDGCHQQRTLSDAQQRGAERFLDAGAELPPVLGLVAIGLHGADLVQRLVHVGADVAHAVLARARQFAHAAAEEQNRDQNQRNADEYQQRQLAAGQSEHHQAAGHQQQIADRHRRARPDHGFEHRSVVGQPRDHLAGAHHLEIAGRQRQQVIKDRTPQVRGHPLAQPRNIVEARVGRERHHDHHAQHERERAVEIDATAGSKATVDDEFQSLPDHEHRSSREQQRNGGEDHLPSVGTQEATDARERLHRRQRRKLGCIKRNRGVGSGHGQMRAARLWRTQAKLTSAWRRTQAEPPMPYEKDGMPLSLPALMTLLAVLWNMITGLQVGRARAKYKVVAPAPTGDPGFERAFRVQANELEQLVAFLPPMWIFAWFGSPRLAALACAVFIAGRVVYAVGNRREARRRSPGFNIAMFASSVTWMAAFVSVVRWLDFA